MFRGFLNIAAIGAGMTILYLFDPDAGRRRRTVLRDRIGRGIRDLRTGLDKAMRDAAQRSQGFVAELRGAVSRPPASDEVLMERVRSKMGRYVSHPKSIHVDAMDGEILLRGPILADEVEQFVEAVRCVPGVKSVHNEMDVHRTPGRVSALQGGKVPPGEHWNIAENNWAPATRLCALTAGGVLAAYGMTQRFPVACALGTVGLGLCLAAARRSGNGRRTQLATGRETQPDREARPPRPAMSGSFT